MERRTIVEPHADRFRMHINFGGRPFWCMFDYAVEPAPGREGMRVVMAAGADQDTVRWFDDLRRGMETGWAELQRDGLLLTGVRVVVTKIHAHPIDTTAAGCERYGRAFVMDLARRRTVRGSGSVG